MMRSAFSPRYTGSESDGSVKRGCDAAGCLEAGLYRAPKSRDALHEYFWFCLDHVRDYNARWNYYAGMNEQSIEAHIRADVTWRRPTWPINGRRRAAEDAQHYREFQRLFADWLREQGLVGDSEAREDSRAEEDWRLGLERSEIAAYSTLGLRPPVSLTALKKRYKTLVKRHHPDANGGSKASEERLKLINAAYATLVRRIAA